MLKKNVFVLGFFYSLISFAFDLEDYAGTYRATRDAYLKAANEEKLATGPFLAAANSWIQVEMTEQLAAGNNDAVEYLIKLKSKASSCQ